MRLSLTRISLRSLLSEAAAATPPIIASTLALTSFAHLLEGRRYTRLRGAIFGLVVLSPLIEEGLMRGILQPSIGLLQRKWNEKKGVSSSHRHPKMERLFRIQITALVFTLLHGGIAYSDPLNALKNLGWIYSGGVAYGYLSERTGHLALPILFHGLNNGLALANHLYPHPYFPVMLIGVRVILCSFLLFRPSLEIIADLKINLCSFSE